MSDPIVRVNYGVVGTRHCDYESYYKEVKVGDAVRLVREPENEFDRNAIRVEHERLGIKIGYVPRIQNEMLAQLIDKGFTTVATVVEHANTGHSDQRMKIFITVHLEDGKSAVEALYANT